MRLARWIKSISPWTLCLFLVVGFLAYQEQKRDPGLVDFFFLKHRLPTKKIVINPYVLTDKQVTELVLHPENEVIQPSAQELNGKNVNVVLRFEKRIHALVWGTVAYNVNSSAWRRINVDPNRTYAWEKEYKYIDYIIPIGVFKAGSRQTDKNLIQAVWDDLSINDYK